MTEKEHAADETDPKITVRERPGTPAENQVQDWVGVKWPGARLFLPRGEDGTKNRLRQVRSVPIPSEGVTPDKLLAQPAPVQLKKTKPKQKN